MHVESDILKKFKIWSENSKKQAKKMRNKAKTWEKFMLFVSQKEAKIMRNGLRFATISHGAKKKFKRKSDTLILSRKNALFLCHILHSNIFGYGFYHLVVS
jgi:hypothetical protein